MKNLEDKFEFSSIVKNLDELKQVLKYPCDAIYHSGMSPYDKEVLNKICNDFKNNLTIYDDNGESIFHFRFREPGYYGFQPFAIPVGNLRGILEKWLQRDKIVEWMNQEIEEENLISNDAIQSSGIELGKEISMNKMIDISNNSIMEVDFCITPSLDGILVKNSNNENNFTAIEILKGRIISIDDTNTVYKFRNTTENLEKVYKYVSFSNRFPIVVFNTLIISNNHINTKVYFDDLISLDIVKTEVRNTANLFKSE